MNRDKPLILITNDDGVDARGLKALTDSVQGLGRLVVFAPDGPRSGMSCAITSTAPLICSLLHQTENMTVYSCSGTPVDCVKLAVNEILDRTPDLLLSGINHGGNQAVCVHYSGTMGAALEGCVIGIPSLGVSLYEYTPAADFAEAGRLGRIVAERILSNGLPRATYLNLNVPSMTGKVRGIAVCRQAGGRWTKEFDRETDANGQTLYWLAGDFVDDEPVRPDNDTLMLDRGYASLVPCLIDATDYALMNTLKMWDFTEAHNE
ncbi:MAG: 5'/3'-nucleotidase SurE [Tannerella sp.]|jgi:5'-nucleotidase|nr:5'/3'-nucleotidase SurE [Tannerella sp.]